MAEHKPKTFCKKCTVPKHKPNAIVALLLSVTRYQKAL